MANNGSPAYTYLWSPSGSNAVTASNLTAGTYTVTVTDANGCSISSTVVITQPTVLVAIGSTVTNVLCNGGSDGSASVAANGGVPGYTYLWSPSGGNGVTASNLTAGTYTVTVTDSHGCTITSTVVITQPTVLVANGSTVTNVLCNGGNNGSASVIANGGSPGYTYAWAPSGGNGITAGNLTAGTYTVTVTDSHGCIITSTAVITQPTVLAANASTITNVLCNGGAIGSVTVAANGGTQGYTYLWSPSGGNGVTASNLAAGTYTITVTDANGCTIISATSVTQPTSLTVNGSTIANVLCNGGNNGSATVMANNGSPAYTYLWSPSGGNGVTASNLIEGTYTVTVSDANGCSITSTAVITQPAVLAANASMVANVLCNGGVDGYATVAVNGGTPGYTYLWTPSGGNGITASNLTADIYTVTITDSHGCTITSAAVITQPAILVANASAISHVLCNGGNNGTGTVTTNGGTPSYTYLWSPLGGNAATAINLSAGTYTITITDANGCSITSTTIITQPSLLTVNATTLNNISCSNASNGIAMVAAGGGTGSYTYLWSPSGGNGTTASNLNSNIYTVTVTDDNGCIQTSTTSITQTNPVVSNIFSSTNVTCNGNNDGQAIVTAGGGAGTYTYLWSPSGGNSATANNLLAGNYTVTITDTNGCSSISTVAITQPAILTSNGSTITNVSCFPGNNGSATVATNGGTPNYTYQWSPTGGNAVTANNLTAGTYTVTVTDANGCSITSTAIITQPTILAASGATITNISCFPGNNGSATVATNGGTPNYTYQWSPTGGNAVTANNLTAGIYTVTVTDANGCSITSTAIITQPTILAANGATITDVSCFAGNNGQATVNVAGGTGAYTYSWIPSGGNSATANNLSANTYTVVVTDANGCLATTMALITQPPALAAAINSTVNIICNGGNNGSTSILANGGTPPYNYSWSPTGGNAAVASNLTAGNYSVTITDAHGCSVIRTVSITQPSPVTLTVNGAATICISQSATIAAVAGGGITPYTYQWSNGAVTASQSVSPAATTNYTVLVTDANGCTVSQSLIITVHPPLNVNANATPPMCAGNTGIVSATAGGGNGGPYTYLWSNGRTTPSFTDNPAVTTTYTVTINDGCSPPVQTTATLIVSPVPVIGFTPHNAAACIPESVNFADTANLIPGATYLWNFGDGTTSTDINPSHVYTNPGQYSVMLTIITAQGCSNTLSLTNIVTAYALPTADFTVPQELSLDEAALIHFNNLSSGSDAWNWDFGDNSNSSTVFNPSHSYTDTGVYTIQLIAMSPGGCPDTAYRTIHVAGEFSIFIPNSFTPNGDGSNDTFTAFGEDIRDFDMWILERWGGKIFHSTSLAEPWDGTYFRDGNICQSDVYVYKIVVHDFHGKEHIFIGHVTLVR
jgi:gliding motility-associated-like protein